MKYNKICKECNNTFETPGPAAVYCTACSPFMLKWTSIEKGIAFKRSTQTYRVILNRKSSGKVWKQFNTLQKARNYLEELSNSFAKEPNTGLHNNICRGGRVGPLHNFSQLRQLLQEKETFTCNRCTAEWPIKKLNIHHIDHDRTNDVIDNFEILCTYCHRAHHNTLGYFPNGRWGFIKETSETIPEGSTPQVNGGGSGTLSV